MCLIAHVELSYELGKKKKFLSVISPDVKVIVTVIINNNYNN